MKNRYQPLAVLLGTVAFLILGGFLLFNSLRGGIREMVNADLAAIATLKSRQVVQWFEDREADAGSLAVDSFFSRAVDRWYADGLQGDRQREMIVKRLNGFISQHRFDAAVLLDGQGHPVLRVGKGPHDTRHAQAQIARAMANNETVFVDMHRHGHEPPELDFISPLRVEGRIVGALYLMEDAGRHLFPLLDGGADMAGLVETHLVRREGDHAMFLSPLRGVSDAELSYRLPLNGQSVYAQALRQRIGGLQLGQDPLGRQALAYALPVRHTEWMLVASADEATAYALVRRLEVIAIALMSFILLLTVAWFAQWQRRQRTMHQAREMQIRLAGEERFHTVFDHAALAMARHALNGDILEVNDNWCTIFGYAREELVARRLNWQQLTFAEDLAISASKVKQLLAGELTEIQMEKRYVRKNGEVFWGEVRVSLVHDDRGMPDYLISAVQDISERKRLEEERNANLMLLQMALDAAQEAVWEWDLETGQARFSPEYYTMLGYLPDEFPSNQQEWLARIHPEDREKVWRTIQEELSQHQDIYVTEYRMQTKDGRYRWLQGRGKCVAVDAQGKPARLVGINIDIHERKQAELQASYLAYHDKLTGLPNRALFFDRFSQAISRAKRDRRHVALLFADLDGFKQVNDMYGHEAGDAVLRMAAQRLLACVRAVDTAVRFGGDEFAVILGDLDDARQAALVAEKVVAAFAPEMMLELGVSCHIGVSIGISMFPENGTTMDGLLTAADQAMYDSKRAGKNTYTFFGEQAGERDEQWIRFDDSHLVGVAEMDDQHRNLVRMVNRLNSEWRNGQSPQALLSLFDELVTATAEHFETEGRYMAQSAYPEQRQHEKEHALLVDEAMRLRKRMGEGGELLALQTIKDWLLNHIHHADVRLAEYLVKRGVQ